MTKVGEPTIEKVNLLTCKLSKREMNGSYPPEGFGRRTPVIFIETAQHFGVSDFYLPAMKLLTRFCRTESNAPLLKLPSRGPNPEIDNLFHRIQAPHNFKRVKLAVSYPAAGARVSHDDRVQIHEREVNETFCRTPRRTPETKNKRRALTDEHTLLHFSVELPVNGVAGRFAAEGFAFATVHAICVADFHLWRTRWVDADDGIDRPLPLLDVMVGLSE